MSVAEIVKEVPNLSLDKMKEVARALRSDGRFRGFSRCIGRSGKSRYSHLHGGNQEKIPPVKWQVAFDPAAEKQFSKLGKSTQQDIERYIAKNLETTEDPRRFGKPYLSIKGLCRYRVGDCPSFPDSIWERHLFLAKLRFALIRISLGAR